MSHPTWVRGLKRKSEGCGGWTGVSHPTWVRGLKHSFQSCHHSLDVAPYVGAWIETLNHQQPEYWLHVAPYVGAWIETLRTLGKMHKYASHPTWVRGLKLACVPRPPSCLGRTLRGCVD